MGAISILSTWSTLDAVKGTVLSGKLGAISSIAVVLAALIAAFTLLKQAADYINGHEKGAWEMFRPVILLTVVILFDKTVLPVTDSMVNVFTRSLAENVSIDTEEYIKKWGENSTQMSSYTKDAHQKRYEAELEEIASKSAVGRFFGKLWIGIKRFLMNLFNVGTLGIGIIIGGLLFLIAKVLLFVQQVLCAVYLTVNALLGPFVFAIGILPSFESGIKAWFSRYIQVAFWVPIGYLMMYINLQVGNAFVGMAAANGASLSADWFMIALQMVALISICAVPKISAWIIESTGANDAHGSLSMPVRTMLRKLIKF